MAWYLFSVRNSLLASSASGWWLCLCLSTSQNSLSLVIPPILPAWLLANQCFIKLIWVINLYKCTRALSHSIFFLQRKHIIEVIAYSFKGSWQGACQHTVRHDTGYTLTRRLQETDWLSHGVKLEKKTSKSTQQWHFQQKVWPRLEKSPPTSRSELKACVI